MSGVVESIKRLRDLVAAHEEATTEANVDLATDLAIEINRTLGALDAASLRSMVITMIHDPGLYERTDTP